MGGWWCFCCHSLWALEILLSWGTEKQPVPVKTGKHEQRREGVDTFFLSTHSFTVWAMPHISLPSTAHVYSTGQNHISITWKIRLFTTRLNQEAAGTNRSLLFCPGLWLDNTAAAMRSALDPEHHSSCMRSLCTLAAPKSTGVKVRGIMWNCCSSAIVQPSTP